MASHFKWYPSDEEVVVPFNARYSFPSQANKAVKMTPRIPPKSGFTFRPGEVIRLEFPAQGYVNPLNTTLEFDVTLVNYDANSIAITRFQNNIQSIFQRCRILYGATPLEDIINYNVIVRCLTEWTGTTQVGTLDQSSVADGIGGVIYANDRGVGVGSGDIQFGLVNVRQNYIQGLSTSASSTPGYNIAGTAPVAVPNQLSNIPGISSSSITCTRRYQISFATGLFTQDKLIPTKFMASQLAIELTLENPAACIFSWNQDTTPGNPPTYGVSNVNLIPEILEFDASYDALFLQGLRDGGVPIKFASWHTFIFGTGGSANLNLQIQERSRSVKALFAIQRRNPVTFGTDSHAAIFCSNLSDTNVQNTLQSFQFRIGGRYFPGQPVQCSTTTGSALGNGAAEAFIELQKSLNTIGDSRLSTPTNVLRWGLMPASTLVPVPAGSIPTNSPYSEFDYAVTLASWTDGATGQPTLIAVSNPSSTAGNIFCTPVGSACFAISTDLETSNGVEISGLNAEEQSDISLLVNYAQPQSLNFVIEVYSYFDAMIILRENNVLELIT